MASHRYIYRLRARTPRASAGWVVQIKHAAGNKTARFHDKDYGNEDSALRAAIVARDAFVEELGLSARANKPDSQHPGVSRTESVNRRDGYPRTEAYWQAYWPKKDGSQATKRFSVGKHGDSRAKELAIAAREHALSALERGDDPFFELPKPSAALWRYMDFTKFLSLLEDASLFFSFAKYFDDPYEGVLGAGNRSKRGFILSRAAEKGRPALPEIDPNLVISCWYAARHESAAMWSLYAKSTDAIAIRTTVGKLRDALPTIAAVGLVKYVDYTQAWLPEGEMVHRYFHKRMSFQHEHELRAVIKADDPQVRLLGPLTENGLKLPIDLNRVVEKVFVSPKSPVWFADLVVSVCKRYGLKAVPARSSLYDDPVL